MGKMTPLEILMAIMVALVWGMGIVFAKGAIEFFPPILLMALRFTLTAFVLVWFTRIPSGNLVYLFFIAIVAAAIQYSLTFTGLIGLEAGTAALIVQLEVPFLVLLGALLLSEKPGLRKWIGIAISFCGVALMTQHSEMGGSLTSVFLVIGGAFSWALGQVMVRSLKNIQGMQVTAWIAVFAAPQLYVMSAIFEEGQVEAIRNADVIVWGAVFYLGLVMTALGYFLWNTLIRRHDVGRVAPFLLLLPFFSVVGGVLFLGEQPTLAKLTGGLVVLLGVAVITINPAVFARRSVGANLPSD
ncbi:DMT family transporter [Roseibium sp. SCP14]|uniref:DMT family transporter n=1 Tax=Roseibium sp. SCP14 TaxID=3141375 RepID=UPI003335BB0F